MLIDDVLIENEDIRVIEKLLADRPKARSDEFVAVLRDHREYKVFVDKLRKLKAIDASELRQLGTSAVSLQFDEYDVVRLQSVVATFKQQSQWTKLTTWFWSKPWSVPVYLIFWGITVAAAWVAGIKTLFEWFSKGTN